MDINDEGPLATWVLDAPPANSIGESEIAAMRRSLDRMSDPSSEVRVLLITANGRFFSTGFDLRLVYANMGTAAGAQRVADTIRSLHDVYADIEALPFATIAVMTGAALGGGLELALACDLRIASAESKVGLPETTLGLIPGAGGTQRLPRMVGRARATRMILLGETMTGDEAEKIGLVHWAVPAADAPEFGRQLAETLSTRSPFAVKAVKRALTLSDDGGSAGFEFEIETTRELMLDEYAAREVAKFFEKSRPPEAEPMGSVAS